MAKGKPVGGTSGQAMADPTKPGAPMQLPGAALPMQTGQDLNAPYPYPPTPPVNPFRGQTAGPPPALPQQGRSGAQTAQTPPWWPPLPPPRPPGLGEPPSPVVNPSAGGMPGIYSPGAGMTGNRGAPIYTTGNLGWLANLFGGGNG